jgi:hypothetical protein
VQYFHVVSPIALAMVARDLAITATMGQVVLHLQAVFFSAPQYDAVKV